MSSVQIPLSQINQVGDSAAFEAAVNDHIARMTEFAKTRGKPRPMAHPLVEMAVKRITHPIISKRPDHYVADYTIVDDMTPPTPVLDLNDKKNHLVAKVRAAEYKASTVIFPELKRRLWSIQYSAAAAIPEDQRTEKDKKLIAHFDEMSKKLAAFNLKAATAEAEIHDLTEENVDSWQPPTIE
jgi:hypothetical protein